MKLSYLFQFALFLLLTSFLSPLSVLAEEYINPELLDIETIKNEEYLDDSHELKWIYIFLAVLNGNVYDTYAADGKADKDGDGKPALEEPNDLNEYSKLPYQYNQHIKIEDTEHISYISTMPNFEEILPNTQNPMESIDIIEVSTETTYQDAKKLIGTKSVPVYESSTGATGVERFIAFYNKNHEEDATLVTSYGFIAIKFTE